MTISFCTTCFNRFHQFKDTFERNLSIISREQHTEWVIADLNSNDGLYEFMLEKLPQISSRVVYAVEHTNKFWHVSKAKNIAHRLGSGDFLVNLDCDNFISNTLEVITPPLAQGKQLIHLWSGTHRDGTSGRVAIKKDLFYSLGGYDESFFPIGYDELDLLARARKSGIIVEHIPCPPNSALTNSKNESTKNCDLRGGLTWDTCAKGNQQISISNIRSGQLVANQGKLWGLANLKVFRGSS